MPMGPHHLNALLAAAFVLFWNSGFIGAEYGLPYAPPMTLLFWRYLALTALLGVVLALAGRLYWPGGRAAGQAALVGVLAHGVWLGCVLVALERGVPAGVVALVVALQPLATGAFAGLVTGERTAVSQWLGLVVGFCGVAIAVGARLDLDQPATVAGLLAPFGSVVAITVASLIERRSTLRTPERQLPLGAALFYQSVATAAVLAPPALLVEGLATQWTPAFVAALGWLIVVPSLFAYSLMWELLRRMNATRVASLFYLGPPVTAVMAWVAFGDQPVASDWLGMGVVVIGVALVQMGTSISRARASRPAA